MSIRTLFVKKNLFVFSFVLYLQ